MYSKDIRSLVSLGLGVLLIGSCSLRIGEEPARDREYQVAGPGCMDQVGPEVYDLLTGKAQEADIKSSFACLRSAFDQFRTYARGREDEFSFNAAEMQKFLRPFLNSREVSQAFILNAMELKAAIIGGPADRLHLQDINRFLKLLDDLEELSLSMAPHMALLSLELVRQGNEDQVSPLQLEAALAALENGSRVMIDIFRDSQGRYNLARVESLIREFRDFAGWETLTQKSKPPEAWSRVLQQVKRFTAGGQLGSIEPREWDILLRSMTGWYSLALRYQYDFRKVPLMYGDGLQRFIRAMGSGFQLLMAAVDAQVEKTIEFGADQPKAPNDVGIMGLFRALEDVGLMPFGVRASSAHTALQALVVKSFNDVQVKPSERHARGITQFTLAQMMSEFERWAQVQRFLDQTFTPGLKPVFEISSQKLILHAQSRRTDLQPFLTQGRPLFKDGVRGVVLTEDTHLDDEGMVYGFKDLSYKNLLQVAAKLILRGYSWDHNRMNLDLASVNEDEFNEFYLDFRSLAIDLKIMDPRTVLAGKRAFTEGNLFTYAADGLDVQEVRRAHVSKSRQVRAIGNTTYYTSHYVPQARLSFHEMVELVAYLFSGGSASRDMVKRFSGDSRELSACKFGPNDPYGDPTLDRMCVENRLVEEYPSYIQNMPGLLREWRDWSREDRQAHIHSLVNASMSKDSKGDWIEGGELSTLNVIQHYIESIFTRYNLNGDDILDTQELEFARPIIAGLVQKLARAQCQDLGPWKADQAFWYILRNKTIPDWTDFVGLVWHWVVGTSVEIHRQDLTTIFTNLMQQSSAASATPIQCPN